MISEADRWIDTTKCNVPTPGGTELLVLEGIFSLILQRVVDER